MFKIGPIMAKIDPKMFKISSIDPKIFKKKRKLQQKSYSWQKVLKPSKSYQIKLMKLIRSNWSNQADKTLLLLVNPKQSTWISSYQVNESEFIKLIRRIDLSPSPSNQEY